MEHTTGCNCEDCWWSNDQKVVDEFGIPVNDEDEANQEISMILSCFRCQSNTGAGAAYQNKQYGEGVRVHNATTSRQGGKLLYRCTICGNERTVSK